MLRIGTTERVKMAWFCLIGMKHADLDRLDGSFDNGCLLKTRLRSCFNQMNPTNVS